MNISQFRDVFSVSGASSLNTLGIGAWAGPSVLDDGLSVYDSVNDSIYLSAGWHDVGVSVQSQDGDFSAGDLFEVLVGRWASGTPTWSYFAERATAAVAAPKRTIRAAVKMPSADHLAVGLRHGNASARDLIVEVQVFN